MIHGASSFVLKSQLTQALRAWSESCDGDLRRFKKDPVEGKNTLSEAGRRERAKGHGVQLQPRALLQSKREPFRSLFPRIRESCPRRAGAPHVLRCRQVGTHRPFRAQFPYWLPFEDQNRP